MDSQRRKSQVRCTSHPITTDQLAQSHMGETASSSLTQMHLRCLLSPALAS